MWSSIEHQLRRRPVTRPIRSALDATLTDWKHFYLPALAGSQGIRNANKLSMRDQEELFPSN